MKTDIKILIVDDEVFNLDIMSYHLEGAGFEVVQAEDGVVALQKLASETGISVIILDRRMPRMDGMAVLERIKENPALNNIPVIVQTAASDYEQISVICLEGTYGYLTKPYEGEELVNLVQVALRDSKRPAQSACAMQGKGQKPAQNR
jgi:CheY-like chemotaxis protein